MTQKRDMDIILKVPVKTYLRKFAHWYEGIPLDQPISLRPGSLIGQILTQVICGKRKYLAYTWRSQPSRVNADTLLIKIPAHIADRGEYFLTRDGEDFFVQALGSLHRDLMLTHILSADSIGQSEKASILRWMDMLKIEEDKDLTFDALKKMSTRARPKMMGGIAFRRGNRARFT